MKNTTPRWDTRWAKSVMSSSELLAVRNWESCVLLDVKRVPMWRVSSCDLYADKEPKGEKGAATIVYGVSLKVD